MTWETTAGTAEKCCFATAKNHEIQQIHPKWRKEEKRRQNTLQAAELSCLVLDVTEENKHSNLHRNETDYSMRF